MKEHNLEVESHAFTIGEKRIEMTVPSMGQQMDYAKKAEGASELEGLTLMQDYFKILGVKEKDFKDLTLAHMKVMLEAVNEVPK